MDLAARLLVDMMGEGDKWMVYYQCDKRSGGYIMTSDDFTKEISP